MQRLSAIACNGAFGTPEVTGPDMALRVQRPQSAPEAIRSFYYSHKYTNWGMPRGGDEEVLKSACELTRSSHSAEECHERWRNGQAGAVGSGERAAKMDRWISGNIWTGQR